MNKKNDEIIAIYNSIGYLQDGIYVKEPDCNACLRDLLKFLRTDNQHTFPIRRQLGESNIVENDLIPLMKQHCINDNQLFDLVLRLLVTLTNPTILLFKEQVPDDKEKKKIYLELNQYLFNYKSVFSYDVKFWSIIAKHMLKILQIECIKREEDDKIMLERMFILIRNVLHVSSQDEDEIVYGEDNLHDKFLLALKLACIYDIFLYICQTSNEYDYCFHILEIYSLIFREQSAEELAQVTNSILMSELEKRKELENIKELQKRNSVTSSNCQKFKYERFKGSSYIVKNFKTIGENDFICHKTISDVSEINFEKDKKIIRKAKNRRHLKDSQMQNTSVFKGHSSSFEVKSHLRELASSFISVSYNNLMKTVRYYLDRSKSQQNDETYYLWASYFFMEFNRCSNANVGYVIETLSTEFLYYLYCLIESYLERLRTDKKNLIQWSKRLHYTLKTYRELIYTLAHIKSNKSKDTLHIVDEIQHKLFYEQDYRELLKSLLIVYDPVKMSDAYLNDLIDANHLFLKLLENYTKKNENIVVANKKRKNRKKKINKKENNQKIDEPELVWTEIASQVTDLLQLKNESTELIDKPEFDLFSMISNENRDEKKLNIIRKINILLYSKRVKESIIILRTARDFFIDDPENTFGTFDIKLEEELIILQDILTNNFLLDLNKNEIKKLFKNTNSDQAQIEDKNEIVDQEKEEGKEEEEEEVEEDDEDENSRYKYENKPFDFKEFIKSYASQKIITPFSLSLKNFESNPTKINNSIIKMFHRIAFDCEMYAMFFQLSFFRIIQKIFNDHLDNSYYQEIVKFGIFVTRNFFHLACKDKNIFIENFYTKSSKESYILEYGEEPVKMKESKRKHKKLKVNNQDDLNEINSNDENEKNENNNQIDDYDRLFTIQNTEKLNNFDNDQDTNDLIIDENNSDNNDFEIELSNNRNVKNKQYNDDLINKYEGFSSKKNKKRIFIEDDEINSDNDNYQNNSGCAENNNHNDVNILSDNEKINENLNLNKLDVNQDEDDKIKQKNQDENNLILKNEVNYNKKLNQDLLESSSSFKTKLNTFDHNDSDKINDMKDADNIQQISEHTIKDSDLSDDEDMVLISKKKPKTKIFIEDDDDDYN